jgi:glycosyltransferase involved in cell wall biosynthesis
VHVVIVNRALIPVFAYGGTERVIWDLAKSLVKFGHRVTFLVPVGSSCDFANVIFLRSDLSLASQIPSDADVVHLNFSPEVGELDVPYIVTEHGNAPASKPLDINTVFVSKNHAFRHGSASYVCNGLDWQSYGPVDWHRERAYFHFLGKAAWRVKNVAGAIDLAYQVKEPLHVLGGHRFNFKRGIRLTFSPRIRFHGMVGGKVKTDLLNGSQGLVFPVRWHEPFGLAVIESMYFGAPVFATPYGALSELVPDWAGCLSNQAEKLVDAMQQVSRYDKQRIHEHAKHCFNADIMTAGYLVKYQEVMGGNSLNATHPKAQEGFDKLHWEN